MISVPDPSWKTHPDIVADESFDARYLMDDEEEDDDERDN